MKTNLRMLVSLAAIAAAAAACGPPQRRSDWRTPTPGNATPCMTDADCNGGVCTVDPAAGQTSAPGASGQGTCSQAPVPSLPTGTDRTGRPDGGAPAPHPPSPLVQPSSSDIQI